MLDKDYHKTYYRNNRKKYKPGIGVAEICEIKKVCKKTVYNNKHRFNRIVHIKQIRFYLDEKIINWRPNEYNDKN